MSHTSHKTDLPVIPTDGLNTGLGPQRRPRTVRRHTKPGFDRPPIGKGGNHARPRDLKRGKLGRGQHLKFRATRTRRTQRLADMPVFDHLTKRALTNLARIEM